MSLILASASPRRRELLARAGVDFQVVPADVDEAVHAGEAPRAYAARVAHDKALTVARVHPEAWVLAADTIVVLGETIFGKADDQAAAAATIRALAGRTHQVMTATCLVGPGGAPVLREICATEVDLRAIEDDELDAYVRSGDWEGKAGAYAAQGVAAAFVTAIRGSYTNVVGLPISEILVTLRRVGAARGDLSRGSAA